MIVIGRKRRSPKPASREFQGFFGEGTTLSGDFRLEGTFRVDGRMTGRISASTLIVGPFGEVDAEEIRVDDLVVHGVVRGRVFVEDRLEIHPGGRVEGSVRMAKPSLFVAPEGLLEASVAMPPPSSGPASETATAGDRGGSDAPTPRLIETG